MDFFLQLQSFSTQQSNPMLKSVPYAATNYLKGLEASDDLPLMLYIHGGAFVMGSPVSSRLMPFGRPVVPEL